MIFKNCVVSKVEENYTLLSKIRLYFVYRIKYVIGKSILLLLCQCWVFFILSTKKKSNNYYRIKKIKRILLGWMVYVVRILTLNHPQIVSTIL